MAITGKEILDKSAAIKNGTSYDTSSAKMKAAVSGGFIGLASGFYYAYSRRESNWLVAGILGAIGGALIARVLIPK